MVTNYHLLPNKAHCAGGWSTMYHVSCILTQPIRSHYEGVYAIAHLGPYPRAPILLIHQEYLIIR